MMKIKYGKYHNFGNSFIVIDETQDIVIHELQKIDLAKQILNPDTGVGADGLIILSIPTTGQGQNIKDASHPASDIHYIFRHFEPDGSESLLCLNGILVTSLFISQIFERNMANLLVATNSKSPQILKIGINENKCTYADGLRIIKIDEELVCPSITEPFLPDIDKITSLEIQLRKDDIGGLDNIKPRFFITGYLTFSGEPHLVIFTDEISDTKSFTDIIFQTPDKNRRFSSGDRLIEAIGMRMQRHYKHLFPEGLNITFVHILNNSKPSKDIIQYRCFERAINKETLSCGTAALAVTSVALALNMVRLEHTVISPYLFNRYYPGSFYQIEHQGIGNNPWKITGKPKKISNGFYFFES